MNEVFEEEKKRQVSRMRTITNYGMGVFFLLTGVFFLVYREIGINPFSRDPSSIDYLIGTMFVVYGIWRIYRGYKKNYFR